MESNLHRLLMGLLIEVLSRAWAHRRDFFVGGNMFLYYSALQARKNDFRGPDFFVVLDTEHRQRHSWVAWEEDGRYPNVILEITSPSTDAIDRGEKKRLYERMLHIPEYFIYDPATQRLDGYRQSGGTYVSIEADAAGRLESRELGLWLGTWHGSYLGFEDTWVRLSDREGRLLPTKDEGLAQAEQERLRAEDRVAALEERLRAYEQRFGALPPDEK